MPRQRNKHNYIKDGIGYIELSQGAYALCDPEDFEMLLDYSWFLAKDEHGYSWVQTNVRLGGRRATMTMSHLLVGSPLHGLVVDHVNNDSLDNRRGNLRVCTRAENCRNQSKSRGRIAYRGVGKVGKRYRAAITHNHERRYLGTFDTAEEAATAYNQAARVLHGSFACENQV